MMDQVTAKINFIEVALGTFLDRLNDSEREEFLIQELSIIQDQQLKKQLKAYVRLSEEKLQDILKFLQLNVLRPPIASSNKRSREEEQEERHERQRGKKEEEFQKVIDSTIVIKIGSETGNGVALSNKKAVTAVHGQYQVNQIVKVLDIHGHEKSGIISFMKYEANKVDIAVIELTGLFTFQHFIPYHSEPLDIDTELRVIGLRDDGTGEFTESVKRVFVEEIINRTAIFHTGYYATETLSGAGVVTIPEGRHFSVVGVYVGKHCYNRRCYIESLQKLKSHQ